MSIHDAIRMWIYFNFFAVFITLIANFLSTLLHLAGYFLVLDV